MHVIGNDGVGSSILPGGTIFLGVFCLGRPLLNLLKCVASAAWALEDVSPSLCGRRTRHGNYPWQNHLRPVVVFTVWSIPSREIGTMFSPCPGIQTPRLQTLTSGRSRVVSLATTVWASWRTIYSFCSPMFLTPLVQGPLDSMNERGVLSTLSVERTKGTVERVLHERAGFCAMC